MVAKGEGKAERWIQAHLTYPHADWCLVWPFARDKHGRGMMKTALTHWAHRYMCILVHGAAPTDKHTAAHSCGNGHGGCVNPHHLSWKTQAENLDDCRQHGTLIRHHGGNRRRILPEEVEAIRGARGFQTQAQLAAKFGVSEGTISDIWHARSHVRQSLVNHWTKQEDEILTHALARGDSFQEAVIGIPGRTWKGAKNRSARLGITRL